MQRQCGKGTRRLHGGPLVSTFYQFSTTQTKSRESQITCFARGILATTTTTFSRPPPSHPPSHNHLPPITSKADSLTYHVNSNAQHLRDRLCVTLYTLRNTDSDSKKKATSLTPSEVCRPTPLSPQTRACGGSVFFHATNANRHPRSKRERRDLFHLPPRNHL